MIFLYGAETTISSNYIYFIYIWNFIKMKYVYTNMYFYVFCTTFNKKGTSFIFTYVISTYIDGF